MNTEEKKKVVGDILNKKQRLLDFMEVLDQSSDGESLVFLLKNTLAGSSRRYLVEEKIKEILNFPLSGGVPDWFWTFAKCFAKNETQFSKHIKVIFLRKIKEIHDVIV